MTVPLQIGIKDLIESVNDVDVSPDGIGESFVVLRGLPNFPNRNEILAMFLCVPVCLVAPLSPRLNYRHLRCVVRFGETKIFSLRVTNWPLEELQFFCRLRSEINKYAKFTNFPNLRIFQ